MKWFLFTTILIVLLLGVEGVCFAGTNSDPGDYPPHVLPYGPISGPDSPDGPVDYPTSEPTMPPTVEPIYTVEPTSIGGESGWFKVDSDPQGAGVSFDGSFQGITPALIKVSTTGTPTHILRVSKTGYQDWIDQLSGNPGPGETISRMATLVEIQPTVTVEPTSIGGESGWFQIDSDPQGADVRVDDSYYGTSPVLVKVMSTGTPSHTIRVTMNGFREYVQQISTNPGKDETIPIFAPLVPLAQYGSIYVSSDPSGAIASLDSGVQYLTPCTFSQVVSGMHTVMVSKAGYNPYTAQIQVNSDAKPRIFAPLTRYQTTGTLYVDSNPQGADLKIDNAWQGQTPQRVGNLESGYHTIKLQLAGYQMVTQQVLISAGQDTRISPSLVRNPPEGKSGSVMVSSNPPGATVYLNNDYQGITPDSGSLDLTDLPPGVYTILIKAPQREEYSTTITVVAGQVTPVQVELKAPVTPSALNGTLGISSSPSGAQVLLDNVFVGITPLTLSSVKPGEYELILKMDGFQDYSNRVQISAGMTTTASVNLSPLQKPTEAPTPAPTQSPVSVILVPISLAITVLLFVRGFRS